MSFASFETVKLSLELLPIEEQASIARTEPHWELQVSLIVPVTAAGLKVSADILALAASVFCLLILWVLSNPSCTVLICLIWFNP